MIVAVRGPQFKWQMLTYNKPDFSQGISYFCALFKLPFLKEKVAIRLDRTWTRTFLKAFYSKAPERAVHVLAHRSFVPASQGTSTMYTVGFQYGSLGRKRVACDFEN